MDFESIVALVIFVLVPFIRSDSYLRFSLWCLGARPVDLGSFHSLYYLVSCVVFVAFYLAGWIFLDGRLTHRHDLDEDDHARGDA